MEAHPLLILYLFSLNWHLEFWFVICDAVHRGHDIFWSFLHRRFQSNLTIPKFRPNRYTLLLFSWLCLQPPSTMVSNIFRYISKLYIYVQYLLQFWNILNRYLVFDRLRFSKHRGSILWKDLCLIFFIFMFIVSFSELRMLLWSSKSRRKNEQWVTFILKIREIIIAKRKVFTKINIFDVCVKKANHLLKLIDDSEKKLAVISKFIA